MISADDVIDALDRGIGRLNAEERQSYLESLGFEFEVQLQNSKKPTAVMSGFSEVEFTDFRKSSSRIFGSCYNNTC